MPAVSVVIPVWDEYVGRGLLDAVASVKAQAVPLELLVVDNASSVPLPPLGEAAVVRLSRRCSTGMARNAALERLRAPYVVFLDADDLLLPGALSAMVSGIDAHPASAAYSLSIIDHETGCRHRSPRRAARALARLPSVFAVANAIWSLLPTQGCTIMRSRDLRSCGGYGDSDHGEDWVLGTSLAFRGRVIFDHRPGLSYRQRDSSPGIKPLSSATLLESAWRVRSRLKVDPAIPEGARRLLPLIAAAQWLAARVAHPVFRMVRARLRPR